MKTEIKPFFWQRLKKDIQNGSIRPFLDRSSYYQILGDTVKVGQGCIFVGNPNQRLESGGFDTCAPFIMLNGKDGKRVLGHIDSRSTAGKIANTIKAHFAPKEIENASYHYFRGAETIAPGQNLGRYAIEAIEQALELLNVKGHNHGALKSGMDTVVVDSNGIKIKRKRIEESIVRL